MIHKTTALNWMSALLADGAPELFERLTFLKTQISEQVFPFTQLPNFTEHGVHHAQNVERNLCQLVPCEIPVSLSPFEVYLLLCSCWLHDSGMAISKSRNEKVTTTRKNHCSRSRKFVLENASKLNLTAHHSKIVAELCYAHGNSSLNELEGERFSVSPYGEVRAAFLAAALRLADALDITYGRAPELVAKNRALPVESRKHWNLHKWISDIKICALPSWDIEIMAMPGPGVGDLPFFNLRDSIQKELDTTSHIFRGQGIYFKKVELNISRAVSHRKVRKLKNPFRLLTSFTSRDSRMFAGRNRESQDVVERVIGGRLVMLIGESGVGKTSLVDAGVCPQLRGYRFDTARFSLQDKPSESLRRSLELPNESSQNERDILKLIEQRIKERKCRKLLIIGDHLEQLFTTNVDDPQDLEFLHMLGRVLNCDLPVVFLFCIREDYLPELYNLSADLPELYRRENTYRLHRLSPENAIEALDRAASHAKYGLSEGLIRTIASDLVEAGEGLVYPPYLQIAGNRLYASASPRHIVNGTIPSSLYHSLGHVDRMVNDYFEGLLDGYSARERTTVAKILSLMVTDYHTKKRTTQEEIYEEIPSSELTNKMLGRLINERVVKRSLGDYELIHDCLARKVIEFLDQKSYLTPPVRNAIHYMEQEFANQSLSVDSIANASGVSGNHLAYLFRNQLHTTVIRELLRVRVAKAKLELKESRRSMAEIAVDCGFSQASVFSRSFRALEGMSPLQYRKFAQSESGSKNGKRRNGG